MQYGIILLLMVTASAIYAETATTSRTLNLNQALINVLELNPQLKANDFEAQAMASRIREAQFTRPYKANINFENFSGDGKYKGSNSLETTLSLSKIFELGNKSELRGSVAQHKSYLLLNSQDAKRLDILAQTARNFIHVVVDQHRLQIAKDKNELVRRMNETVRQRVKAGRSPVAEQRRVAIAVARAEIEYEHAEHELMTSRIKLASMWGAIQPQFTTATADLFRLEKVADFKQLQQQLDRNPDLIQFITAQRLAEAKLNLARARQSTNIELNAGVRHFNETDDNAIIFSASIPLGQSSRAEPVIEAQQFELAKGTHEYAQKKNDLYVSLFEICQEMQHAYTAANIFAQRIIPEAKSALRDYDKGYRAGRYSLLELTDAQQELLAARLERVMIAASYHRYKIEIDRLTGTGLVTPPVSAAGVSQ